MEGYGKTSKPSKGLCSYQIHQELSPTPFVCVTTSHAMQRELCIVVIAIFNFIDFLCPPQMPLQSTKVEVFHRVEIQINLVLNLFGLLHEPEFCLCVLNFTQTRHECSRHGAIKAPFLCVIFLMYFFLFQL